MINNFCYTILTSFIILLGKLRDNFCITKKTATLRFDRVIPWADYNKNTFMGCCDCGLAHFIVPHHSVTPTRTEKYSYRFRFGANAWHKPDESLIDRAYQEAQNAKVIG